MLQRCCQKWFVDCFQIVYLGNRLNLEVQVMIKFCSKYLGKYKRAIIIYFMLIIVTGVFNVIVPMITGSIVDAISEHDQRTLCSIIKLFVVVQVFLITFNLVKNNIYIKLQTNIAFSIISDVIFHIQNVEICISEKYEMGYLNQRINNDSNSLSTFIIGLFGDFFVNTLTLFFSTYILMKINYILGVVLLVVGIIYIIIYVLLRKKLYMVSYKLKEEQADFFSAMLMQLAHIKFVKIHSLVKDYQKKMKISYLNYFTQVLKSQNVFYIYASLDSMITIFANISIFTIGGGLVMSEKISIGTFTIVISYFNYIIQSFKYYSSLGRSYQDNMASYNRILELLKIKEEIQGNIVIEHVEDIMCENLGFERDGKKIIENFTQKFVRGTVYCICGNNGVGKSTLINVLIGLYPNTYTGNVLYNSIKARDINMEKLRYKNISVMEQELLLLKGEIKDNILLSSNYDIQNINIITKNKEETEEFIKSLGEIYESKGGVSGGEAQKIGIYRAFAKDADIFILDEPTASLDKKSAEYYIKKIIENKKNKIVIIISHDENVINMCDCIIRL